MRSGSGLGRDLPHRFVSFRRRTRIYPSQQTCPNREVGTTLQGKTSRCFNMNFPTKKSNRIPVGFRRSVYRNCLNKDPTRIIVPSYIQSNMNNDNALLNGRTMDFGPFGMLEEYDSKQTIWVGDAGYFAFENQLSAGAVIFFTLLQACAGLFTPPNFPETEFNKFAERATAILKEYMPLANRKWHARLGAKLGFGPDGWGSGGSGENLPVEKWWKEAKVVLEREKVDYTHFFRALAEFSEEEFRAVSSMGETGKIRIEGTGFERMLYRGSGKWEGPVENVVKGWIKVGKMGFLELFGILRPPLENSFGGCRWTISRTIETSPHSDSR